MHSKLRNGVYCCERMAGKLEATAQGVGKQALMDVPLKDLRIFGVLRESDEESPTRWLSRKVIHKDNMSLQTLETFIGANENNHK